MDNQQLPPEEGQEEAVNNPPLEDKRTKLRDRIKERYPDDDLDDDDTFYDRVNKDYDDYESELGTHREQAQKLSDMFSTDPRSAEFLQDWQAGEDPVMSLIKRFGVEIRDILDDPDRQEEIAEANQQYLLQVAENKRLDEEYQANQAESLDYLERLQDERGIPDEEIDAAMALLIGIVRDGIVGKFSPETIEMALKAVNYERDLNETSEEAELRGRNAKITEKLRKPTESDGLPQLGGGNAGVAPAQPQRRSIFDIAKGAQ